MKFKINGKTSEKNKRDVRKISSVEVISDSVSQNDFLPSIIPNYSKDLAIIPERGKVGVSDSKDPLRAYLKEISKYDLLSPEQENILTKQLVETGDIEVAKKLVVANLRLVVKIAMEYRSAYQNVLDLIQEGNIGLMKAVSKYNPDRGAKLSYYASWWIRSYILRYILSNFRLVKIGTTNEQKKLFYNLKKEKERLEGMGIVADTKLLSEHFGVSEKSINVMNERMEHGAQELGIDHPLSEGKKGTLADILADEKESFEEDIDTKQSLEILNKHLKSFVEGLKERDKEIFTKRLLSEVPPSLQSIADEYGVTRERVRQIEERLINNLKVYMSEYLR